MTSTASITSSGLTPSIPHVQQRSQRRGLYQERALALKTAAGGPVVIEAALNGGRSRASHPEVPTTPEEIAADAQACVVAGASVVHIHAQTMEGEWITEADWYAEAHRRIRERVPETLISITSIRPEHVDVSVVTDLIEQLSADAGGRPDLVSINLGHLTNWVPDENDSRQTRHFPNSYEDIAALLTGCSQHGIVPELGLMDLGFVSNAVALQSDGLLPERPWFLIELDSPAYGSGNQTAPSTVENYDLLNRLLGDHFPKAAWAAHGVDLAGYEVLARAIDTCAHVRVGIEDAIFLPGRDKPATNAEQVAWAVHRAAQAGRKPATPAEARAIMGISAAHAVNL